MASTIRISDSAKRKMLKLIQYLGFKTDKKITQTEILDLLIESGIQQKENLLEMIVSEQNSKKKTWEEDSIFTNIDLDLGEEASETVDEIIYGD